MAVAIPTTYHLTPVEVWNAQRAGIDYAPEAFAAEGFIHCTDGEARLIEVGNRYYTADPRDFLVLTIDLERVSARVVYEDADGVFPHIYGRLDTAAVIAVRSVIRSASGAFFGIGEPVGAT